MPYSSFDSIDFGSYCDDGVVDADVDDDVVDGDDYDDEGDAVAVGDGFAEDVDCDLFAANDGVLDGDSNVMEMGLAIVVAELTTDDDAVATAVDAVELLVVQYYLPFQASPR